MIADARGTTPPVLNAFLETLYTVQVCPLIDESRTFTVLLHVRYMLEIR